MFQVCQPPALPNYTTAECAGVFQSVISFTGINECEFLWVYLPQIQLFYTDTSRSHKWITLYTRKFM